MKHLHEKSPCCGAKIKQHGGRRRQCLRCKKTWRVWLKKRGRKKCRYSFSSLLKFLNNDNGPLAKQASRLGLKPNSFQRRIRKNLESYIKKTPWPKIPNGKLIVIADAIEQNIQGNVWTIYFVLFRAVKSNQAVISPPAFYPGIENFRQAWRVHFKNLPNDVKKRVLALVCDGNSALVSIAKQQGWILQRCHFHLKHRIANYIRTGPMARRRVLGLKIKKLVDTILLEPDENKIIGALEELKLILFKKIKSRFLKKYIRGFINNYQHYRSYLYYPELNLPNTSNSVESLNNLVRNMQHKARGFRSKRSLEKWIIALCKFRQSITCNGKEKSTNKNH